MKKTYIFLNASFFFWFLTLIGWFFSHTTITLFSFVLSIIFLILYFSKKKVSKMFTKRQNKESAPKVAAPVAAKDTEILTTKEEHGAVSTPTINEEKTNTIISKDVVFEGNITSNEQVHIYGKVIGNITGKDNIVKVMLNGQVNGNITCKELIVNGRIDGECLSDSISIETHGEITGIINYSSLSIKKGGILSGQANVKTSTINTNKQAFPKDKIKKDTAVNQPIEPASL